MSIYVFSWEEFWAGSLGDGTCLGRLSSLVVSEVISTHYVSHDFQSSYNSPAVWILSACTATFVHFWRHEGAALMCTFSFILNVPAPPLFLSLSGITLLFLGSFVCPVLLHCLTVLLFKASANHTSWPALPGCITQEKYILMAHPCFWFPSWN